MKNLDLTEIDNDVILICLNCGYIDTADTWKSGNAGGYGYCNKCNSQASAIYDKKENLPLKPEPSKPRVVQGGFPWEYFKPIKT